VESSIAPVLIRASPRGFTAHNNRHKFLSFSQDTRQISIRYKRRKEEKEAGRFKNQNAHQSAPSLKCPVKHWKKVSSVLCGHVIKWNFSWAKGAGILIFEMVACSYFFFPVDTHQVSCEK
jgi:hypothetical protein